MQNKYKNNEEQAIKKGISQKTSEVEVMQNKYNEEHTSELDENQSKRTSIRLSLQL